MPNFVSAGKSGKAGGGVVPGASAAAAAAAAGWPGYGAAKENQHQMAAGVKARINSKHNAQQQVIMHDGDGE